MPTVAEVLTAVSERAVGASADLKQSLEIYEHFRAPTRSPVHLEVVVGVPVTTTGADRQKPSVGTLATTEVRVVLAFQVGSKERSTNFSAALQMEDTIRKALLERSATWPGTNGLSLTHQTTMRDPGPVGWVFIEQTYSCLHHLSLQ